MRIDNQESGQGLSIRPAIRFQGSFFAVCAACAFAATPALGAPLQIAARQDTTQESYFTLDFGGFGGVASAMIARTDFQLEIDAAAGSARFLQYDQDIAPLTLPGGISTGNIRVEVVPGSSSGTFNSSTGEFATSEVYEIHFEGDLSAYGLTSPVLLPSASAGVATISSPSTGVVSMNWSGSSQLLNPFVPGSSIDFSYFCSLLARFSPEAATYISLELISQVINTPMSTSLRSSLIGLLDSAIDYLNAGNMRRAARTVNTFIATIQSQTPTGISSVDAAYLIINARYALALINGPPNAAAQQ